ncbi:MAG: hypothetical protein GY820_21895, partial [Gammaproteobacteria bacterium]|nr:hypothetical protein [Gammaproteobacteria bacterium]
KIINHKDKKNIVEAYRLLEEGRLAMAMEKFNKQISVNPYATRHYREFAKALEKQKHFKEAYAVYETLLVSDNQAADKCWNIKNISLYKKYLEDGEVSQLVDKLKDICGSRVTFIE